MKSVNRLHRSLGNIPGAFSNPQIGVPISVTICDGASSDLISVVVNSCSVILQSDYVLVLHSISTIVVITVSVRLSAFSSGTQVDCTQTVQDRPMVCIDVE